MSCRFCARSSKGWNVAKLENCGDLRRNNSYQLSETEWRRAQYSNKPFHDACIWSMSQPPITPSFLVSKHLVQSCARSGTISVQWVSLNETVNGATSNTLHDACNFKKNKYQEHPNVRIWRTFIMISPVLDRAQYPNKHFTMICIGNPYRSCARSSTVFE